MNSQELDNLLDTLEPTDPISEDWLRANGFKWTREFNGVKHWELRLNGKGLIEFSADLIIDVSHSFYKEDDWWHCWVVTEEPRRNIHVRHMRTVDEIKLLYQGLTGVRMECAS